MAIFRAALVSYAELSGRTSERPIVKHDGAYDARRDTARREIIWILASIPCQLLDSSGSTPLKSC